MGRNLEKRLRNVEEKLTEIRKQEMLANCNCHAVVSVSRGMEKEFEAELNRTCPAHGFREVIITHFVGIEPADHNGNPIARIIPNPVVDELIKDYDRRRAEAKRAA